MLVKVLDNTKKEAKKLLPKYAAFSVKTNVLLQVFFHLWEHSGRFQYILVLPMNKQLCILEILNNNDKNLNWSTSSSQLLPDNQHLTLAVCMNPAF